VFTYLLLTFTLLFLVYWFRYQCLLVLKTNSPARHAGQVARANDLRFPEVQACLESGPRPSQLPALHDALAADYRILTALLSYTAAFDRAAETLELRLLVIDFRAMQLWYVLARRAFPAQAARALEECSRILSCLADALGRRAVLLPGA
jgi:hypothetical protein